MKLPWNIIAIAVLVIFGFFLAGRSERERSQLEKSTSREVKVVSLDPGDSSYFWLLKGDPDTKSLRSGLVTLAPGKSIGAYNSGTNEEMLVPLEGQGEIRFPDHSPVAIKPGLIAYAPAHTEHDVANTGSTRLRYIFITAKVE